jgi:hypothetical protein
MSMDEIIIIDFTLIILAVIIFIGFGGYKSP